MKKKILELETIRGIAAMYIFFHHTIYSFIGINKSSLVGFFFRFGQEAVMIFFILSGYVIALSINNKKYSFKEYFKHRFLRIYPIIILAWIISLISFYIVNNSISLDIYNLIINILMMQDISSLKPGVLSGPLFGNSPLWSLSYEWWFYIIFFFHYYIYTKYLKQNKLLINHSALFISIIGLITYKLYFNQFSLFAIYYYIWFSGALVFFLINSKELSKKNLFIIFTSYLILIVMYILLFIINSKVNEIGSFPILTLRHYVMSLFFLFFALYFYKYIYKKIYKNIIYKNIIFIFSSLGSISFSLYVFHVPIKNIFFLLLNNWNGPLLLIISLLTTILLSYIAEIKIYKYIRNKFII